MKTLGLIKAACKNLETINTVDQDMTVRVFGMPST